MEKEKHIPVIECPAEVKAGELFDVKVTVGKEMAHPNTSEHHIRWITVFFQPEGEKFVYQVGTYEIWAHGESTEGPNTGPVYSHSEVAFSMEITKSGTLYALALYNIHGLWEHAKRVKRAPLIEGSSETITTW